MFGSVVVDFQNAFDHRISPSRESILSFPNSLITTHIVPRYAIQVFLFYLSM